MIFDIKDWLWKSEIGIFRSLDLDLTFSLFLWKIAIFHSIKLPVDAEVDGKIPKCYLNCTCFRYFFLRFEKTYQLLKLNGFGLQFKWMPVQMNDCICITQTQDYLHISAQTQEYTALQHQVKISSLKNRISQNELMKSSILQNSNWKICRISALASKTRSNQ